MFTCRVSFFFLECGTPWTAALISQNEKMLDKGMAVICLCVYICMCAGWRERKRQRRKRERERKREGGNERRRGKKEERCTQRMKTKGGQLALNNRGGGDCVSGCVRTRVKLPSG